MYLYSAGSMEIQGCITHVRTFILLPAEDTMNS
jgi:hypothetical protein